MPNRFVRADTGHCVPGYAPWRGCRSTQVTLGSKKMPQYREATKDDLPAICMLGEEVNELHHIAWPHIFAPIGQPLRDMEHWSQSVEHENATTFVAVEAGTIAGFVTVGVVTEIHSLLQPLRYARVGSVGVTASFRGQGIGTKLMALAEKWARERGGLDLRLHVFAFNEHALQMYKELGFEVLSHSMAKRLSPNEA